MLEVKDLVQLLVGILIPVGLLISDTHTVQEGLNVLLHHLSVDLKRQHQVGEGSPREFVPLSLVEDLLKLTILFLGFLETSQLLVGDCS